MYSDWNFILSTASTLEGYHIIKQCGVVFGETVFKHSFLDTLSASISNTFDSLSLRGKEMSGSVDLIETAREHAYEKMINQAKKKGANAIIAIESDNTIGNNIMYISLYGTAVKVLSDAEYKRHMAVEKSKQELAQKEKAELEEKRAQYLEKMKEDGNKTHELKFLEELSNKDTIRDINMLWENYGLDIVYPKVDISIKSKLGIEKLYGIASKTTQDLIDFLKTTLMNMDEGVSESDAESKHFDSPLSAFDGICPVCGTKYFNSDRKKCFKCGSTFAL